MDLYQTYIHKSRYARYLDDKQRREHWPETVARYFDFMEDHLKTKFDLDVSKDRKELELAVLNHEIMPSMRAMMTAGKALARDNTAGYNCSYLPVDDPKAFDEAMFILLCGTGVGFSVERQYVNKLPEVPDILFPSDTTIVVKDSKEGWAKALRQLIALLYAGEIPQYNTDKVRPAGSRLKTFGGRSSGPGPLIQLFEFVIGVFRGAVGRKLTTLECHDIMCKIADVVVVGGVRRSAMISLSDLDDPLMRNAKSIYNVTLCVQKGNTLHFDYVSEDGVTTKHYEWTFDPDNKNDVYNASMIANEHKVGWWLIAGHRALSNNSAVYTEKPGVGKFLEEWLSLYMSKSGERGIFSRDASVRQAAKNGRRDTNWLFGTNPCSEIILRPYQFCNLTEVIIRSTDTENDIARKVKLATILGTWQSTLTHFPYLRKIWKKNTEEERLLGVSMTGIYDNPLTNNYNDKQLFVRLEWWKGLAVETNKVWAEKLGIPQAAAVTCVKPSGTVSQLTGTSSGIHPSHDYFYFRRVRSDNKDPLTKFLIDQGVPFEPDLRTPENTTVFTFPKKVDSKAITRNQVSAIDHLNLWLIYQRHWCEHKPSVTINVKEGEWPSVAAWVWDHFDELSGVSFLPYDGGMYKQAPYETIDEETYNKWMENMPKEINWDALIEIDDNVEGVQTLACASGGCEI